MATVHTKFVVCIRDFKNIIFINLPPSIAEARVVNIKHTRQTLKTHKHVGLSEFR